MQNYKKKQQSALKKQYDSEHLFFNRFLPCGGKCNNSPDIDNEYFCSICSCYLQ